MKFILANDGKTAINLNQVRVIFIGKNDDSCRVYANSLNDHYNYNSYYGVCLKDFSEIEETEDFKLMQSQMKKLAGNFNDGNAFKLNLDKNVMAKNYFDKLLEDLNADNPYQFILAESGTEAVNIDNISSLCIESYNNVTAKLFEGKYTSGSEVTLKRFDYDTDGEKAAKAYLEQLLAAINKPQEEQLRNAEDTRR